MFMYNALNTAASLDIFESIADMLFSGEWKVQNGVNNQDTF